MHADLITISEDSQRFLVMVSLYCRVRYDLAMPTWRETSTTSAPVAGFRTKLSSAGLVYKHFGLDIIAKLMNLTEDDEQVIVFLPSHSIYMSLECKTLLFISQAPLLLQVKKVYLAVYKHFMEAIDAIDNGQLY